MTVGQKRAEHGLREQQNWETEPNKASAVSCCDACAVCPVQELASHTVNLAEQVVFPLGATADQAFSPVTALGGRELACGH